MSGLFLVSGRAAIVHVPEDWGSEGVLLSDPDENGMRTATVNRDDPERHFPDDWFGLSGGTTRNWL